MYSVHVIIADDASCIFTVIFVSWLLECGNVSNMSCTAS